MRAPAVLRWLRRLRRPTPAPVLDSLDAYARWAAAYPPHAHNALMQAEEAAMRDLLPELRAKVVLDLACGTGRYGLLAQAQGAGQIVALDNSPAMLNANPLAGRALAVLDAIPLPGQSVDVVLCGLALGHLPHIAPALHEMARVLKPGGTALLSDIHPCIALGGGQRTFTAADGRTYAVEHYPHLYSDYHQAAAAAGLQIIHVVERSIAHAPSAAPAVIVYALRRPH